MTPRRAEAFSARVRDVHELLTGLEPQAARARAQVAIVGLLGKINGAVGNYNAHLAAYPDNVAVRAEIGTCLMRAARYEEAVEEFTRAADFLRAQSRTDDLLKVGGIYVSPVEVV